MLLYTAAISVMSYQNIFGFKLFYCLWLLISKYSNSAISKKILKIIYLIN